MLPGFRFVFAAIMLSMSLLIFGLGAAALLRAAHEEFASNPSWRAAPEMTFAQRPDATMPVLATLRVDLPVVQKAQDEAAAPAAQVAIAPLKPEQSSQPDAVAKWEVVPVEENLPANDAAPASPENTEELKVATIATDEVSSREDQQIGVLPEPNGEQLVPEADNATTKIATLGGPPVDVEIPPPAKSSAVKADQAKPNEDAIKKRQEAKRAAHRRRLAAARARLAAQAQLQQTNPFFQPPPATHSR